MIDRDFFFFHIRAGLFRSMTQSQVDGCNAIIDAWEKDESLADLRWVSYALATAYHETAATMQPIAEYGHGYGRAYGVGCGPYGKVYYGRGLVQLTWITGYENATKRLRARGVIGPSVDLVRNPELALDPAIASAIAIFGMLEGWFTGKKLADYFGPDADDAVNARRIINGTDCAGEIAGEYEHFLSALSS